MNAQNELMRQALANAMGAVFSLHDRGCTVVCAVVNDGKPRLLIEPPQHAFEGVVQSTRIDAGKRREVCSIELNGCRVEWEARRAAA